MVGRLYLHAEDCDGKKAPRREISGSLIGVIEGVQAKRQLNAPCRRDNPGHNDFRTGSHWPPIWRMSQLGPDSGAQS